MTPEDPVVVHDDERGRLLSVEFADLPFVPRRSFVVVAPDHAVTRGGHHAACRELIIVVNGKTTVSLRDGGGAESEHRLAVGDRLLVESDLWLSYVLEEPGTTLLVLADAPYDATLRARPQAEG